MKGILILLVLFKSLFTFSQVGIGTTTVDPSAILEIVSTDSGILLPKISLTGTDDVTTITNPQNGLIIYNTTASGTGSTAISANSLYIFNGTALSWERLNNEQKHEYGDFKYCMQAIDHNGWYILDGRLVSTLSTTAQTVASALGFTTNLPNLADKILKQKGALGVTGGANTTTFSITQANLPNVDFTGTTISGGSHSHDINSINSVSSGLGIGLTTLYSNTTGTINTATDGTHSHDVTVSSGGSGTSIDLDVENPYFSANAFIYLGY